MPGRPAQRDWLRRLSFATTNWRWPSARHGEAQRCAPIRCRFGPDASAMRLDETTRDRQPQSGAGCELGRAFTAVTGALATIKAFEDALAILGRDARTAVDDSE